MSEALKEAFRDSGSHTAESLTERLPGFPPEAVRDALEALTAQGVLERSLRPDGTPEYRYVAPEKYVQQSLDVVRNPGDRHNPERRRRRRE